MKKKGIHKGRGPKLVGVWIMIMILFIAELFLYTRCRVQWVSNGLEVSKARKDQIRLEKMQQSLKIEIERLKSPRRIAEIARKRLQLDMPTPEQMVIYP
jgi:cell division protein FtsL